MKIGIIGTGTWGLALGILLSDNGHELTMWSAIAEETENLRKTRVHPVLGTKMDDSIIFTTDMEEAMKDKELLVLAVPSIYTRSTAQKMKPYYKPEQIIVSVGKGIEEDTLKTLVEQIGEEIPGATVSVLCGPSHAEEVAKRLPTVVVSGCRDQAVAEKVRDAFMSPIFRVYTSDDVMGMELGSSLKNVIALAAGIADGLGYGDNTKAALITRGITEIARLGCKMGGRRETFYGLTGIGDLIVTCASMHSRNRRAGILIGQGKSMQEAMDEVHMVVEGVYSAKAARELAEKYNVRMPIVTEVNRILFEGKDPKLAVDELMTRDSVAEPEAM
jgi:glycerol-3-phosphate dehydrogenase (NAD(P)+)